MAKMKTAGGTEQRRAQPAARKLRVSCRTAAPEHAQAAALLMAACLHIQSGRVRPGQAKNTTHGEKEVQSFSKAEQSMGRVARSPCS